MLKESRIWVLVAIAGGIPDPIPEARWTSHTCASRSQNPVAWDSGLWDPVTRLRVVFEV